MDTPDRPPAGSAAAASRFEDSPVFNFINSLSPIPPPKPLDSSHNVQLFKPLDFAPVSSIFTSPHVNPQKESKLPNRDASAQLSEEGHSPSGVRTRIGASNSIRLSKCTIIAAENCSITCSLNEATVDSHDDPSILPSKLPRSIQLDGSSLENDKKPCGDGKADLTLDQEHTKLEGVLLDHNGLDKTKNLADSGRIVQENQLSKQHKDELAACDWEYLITGQASSSVSRLDPSVEAEAQLVNETLKIDNGNSCKSFLSKDAANLENSRRKLFHGSSGPYIHNAAQDPHVCWAGAVEGAETDYTPQILPGACQSQLMLSDQICDKINAPSDYMPMDHKAISQHLRGMRRRSLFNEKAGASYMGVHCGSNLRPASSSTPKCKSISGDHYLKPVKTPPCALPGIGLHLNALAPISKDKVVPYDTQSTGNQSSNMPSTIGSPPPTSEQNSQINSVAFGSEFVPFSSEVESYILNDDSSQTAMPANADESGQDSPKKKRRKVDNGDGESCKRCSCKKSKCLKLYCECFAAGVYCSEPCSCQGCLNKPIHEETVLSTRKQIESRNPLAFAPKVIRTSEPGQELGEDTNKTPASARHKRGCNCKKSYCLKKYCECYQGGVGCSMSCRCEGCKNAFGRRDGVVLLLGTEEIEQGDEEKNACEKEEKNENDKQLAIVQTDDLPSSESLLSTPSIEACRSLVNLPPTSSKPPRSSTIPTGYSSRLYNSQVPLKSEILLSPFESYAEMILGDGTPDMLKGESSPCNGIKVVSPNQKRVSPPRIGAGLSPICKSGRKLILKSIPSFPSLTGDVNSEHPVNNSSSSLSSPPFGT